MCQVVYSRKWRCSVNNNFYFHGTYLNFYKSEDNRSESLLLVHVFDFKKSIPTCVTGVLTWVDSLGPNSLIPSLMMISKNKPAR